VTTDPIQTFAHDHVDLNRRVLALGAAMQELEARRDTGTQPLVAPLGELREILFAHFAHEEEGLFPFVVDLLPDLADRVHELEKAHDAICGALARMYELARAGAELATIAPLFRRFETAYAEHSTTEAALLKTIDLRLVPEHRVHLATLIDGL
jgi:hemerythrin